ncbi:hypothetical protein EI42_03581 [Thermosporothrix hazakensis]|uniref:AAA+ ATPase domain-containing protein n=2 Tax=Thermosporothrix hazakensis TaxID=644383 RepID=A0A326U4C4_THEHA|nr:hypothetical protein EI42_03581 [Thermosporothrix hazakensis]
MDSRPCCGRGYPVFGALSFFLMQRELEEELRTDENGADGTLVLPRAGNLADRDLLVIHFFVSICCIERITRKEKIRLMYDDYSVSSFQETHELFREAIYATSGLALLQDTLNDETAQAVLSLFTALGTQGTEATEIARAYGEAFRMLARAVSNEAVPTFSDAWQAYLIARLLDNENPWSRQVECHGAAGVSPVLREQARRDLRALQKLFQIDADTLLRAVLRRMRVSLPVLSDAWLPWRDLAPLGRNGAHSPRHELALIIAETKDWGELVEPLERYWSLHGTGPLARYRVLRWQGVEEGLQGIAHPDPIQLANLVGYDQQQARLKANTERFLAGLPAHDTLLYGAPGTGKSSTVKALVNHYADRGLRLVEVRREQLGDLHRVVRQLRERAPRYILFVDDLSFEEHETEYKVLKMLLEGTAEARPANILIYATTNRMNLIRENFQERGKPGIDTNWRDTMDEKQSLVHRFGLRVTFTPPAQAHYLEIVRSLAEQRGLELPEEELYERALRWERQHNGRSGRVARQFVDDLEGELKDR